MNQFYQSGNNWINYPTTLTTTAATTAVTSPVMVINPQIPMQIGGPPVVAEDEMAWLLRRVSEITGLVAA